MPLPNFDKALKLSIQTSLSVAPELPVFLSLNEKCLNFRKTSTPQDFGSMCSIVFLTFTLKLPIEIILSVLPKHSCHRTSAKRAHPRYCSNSQHPLQSQLSSQYV